MSRTAADLIRDAIATNEAHAVYTEAAARLQEEKAPLHARRVQRAARAELIDPDPPDRPCRICGGETVCVS